MTPYQQKIIEVIDGMTTSLEQLRILYPQADEYAQNDILQAFKEQDQARRRMYFTQATHADRRVS